MKIKQLYIEIVKVNLWWDEKLHRRFLFWDWPVIDEKSLTDKYLGKPLYLSEEFSKRYEKFLNDSLSVLKITTTQIGLEVLLLCELLQITPFDLSLSEISNEIIEENINKEECTFYNNVSSDIPINIKETHLFEYDSNNDRIEENNFFISYFVPDIEEEVKRVNWDTLKEIKQIVFFGNNIPESAEIAQEYNKFSSRRKYLESVYEYKWLELWEYSIDSKMNSNIENYEKGICSEYKKHINLSIDQLKNNVIEVLEKENKESKAIQKRKIWIKGFP